MIIFNLHSLDIISARAKLHFQLKNYFSVSGQNRGYAECSLQNKLEDSFFPSLNPRVSINWIQSKIDFLLNTINNLYRIFCFIEGVGSGKLFNSNFRTTSNFRGCCKKIVPTKILILRQA